VVSDTANLATRPTAYCCRYFPLERKPISMWCNGLVLELWLGLGLELGVSTPVMYRVRFRVGVRVSIGLRLGLGFRSSRPESWTRSRRICTSNVLCTWCTVKFHSQRILTSALTTHNTRHTGLGKFRIWGIAGGYSTCSWRVTTYVGKPSILVQPTRLTQPFIFSG